MTLTKQSVAVVTGAASGIGRALAIRLSQEGIAGLALADVDEAGLSETAELISVNVKISRHVVDVGSRDRMQKFADEAAHAHDGRVTHLVNNAGVGLLGSFEQISLDDMEWLMNINFWGTVYGVKFFLPVLKKQPAAHIVNLSSVFGFIAPPEQTAYCASKFAIRGFTESLRHELAATNIRVSLIHPGGIKTNIARNSRLGAGAPADYKTQGAKFFDKVAMTSPETAAETIVRGIKDENPRILIGSDARLISYIHRLFPKNYLRVLQKLSGHRMSLRE